MTFKEGDRVEFTTEYRLGKIQPGDKATVTADSDPEYTAVRTDSGIEAECFHHRLKLIEEGFKVGDKVTVDASYEPHTKPGNYVFAERPAEISNVRGSSHSLKFTDEGKAPHLMSGTFGKQYIKALPEEKPFTFADIQKGDTIRRTETWETGTVRVYEGVVTDVNSSSAYTAEGLPVGHCRDKDNKHLTLELVNRPEPEPKLWEKAEVGDSIIREKSHGHPVTIFTKKAEDLWTSIYLHEQKAPEQGYRWNDEEFDDLFKGETLHLVKA